MSIRPKPMPAIVDAMTPFPYTIETTESLKNAISIMATREIRHLPVVEGPRLVGLLSDRDIKLALAVGKGLADESALLVEDVCVLEPYIVPHTEKLDAVLRHMVENRIGSALVTRSDKLVGIFTVSDACKKLEELLKLLHPDA